MNIYMAACYEWGIRSRKLDKGTYFELNEIEKKGVDSCEFLLESYYYCRDQKLTDLIRDDATPIFLDSGAFSAFTLNAQLSVEEYCNYIHHNMDIIRVEDGVLLASVLDGIGDPLQTWRNQTEMELRGIRPLPCFHANEDFTYLQHYINNYSYIALGGVAQLNKKALIDWLDHIWGDYLTDGSGRAKLKVHGFGITSIEIMERYPWHSCDSSAWVQAASFGEIVLPKHGRLIVSDKSSSKHVQGRHLFTLSQIEREYVINSITEQGYDYERLASSPFPRGAYNMNSFKIIENAINSAGVTFKSAKETLF